MPASYWRRPFAASALAWGSVTSSASKAWLGRFSPAPLPMLRLGKLLRLTIDHFPSDPRVLEGGVSVGEAAALLFPMFRRGRRHLRGLDQSPEILRHFVLRESGRG